LFVDYRFYLSPSFFLTFSHIPLSYNLEKQQVPSAQWNVEHHLDKLEKDGKARQRLGFWHAI